MADASTTSTTAAPAATTYATEAELRLALVAGLQAVQAILAANAGLWAKTLPADLDQLNKTLGFRIKDLPIKA